MKTLHKYTLSWGNFELRMPKNAVILTVHEQKEDICLWAEVDTEQPKVLRQFEVIGTGHPMHEDTETDRKYLGTVHLSLLLVFHIYELTNS